MFRNQETSDRTIADTKAVVKLSIVKPGTSFVVPQRRRTFIKKAAIPKVKIERGSAIIWSIGRMNVLTRPMTMAATTPVQMLAR